MNIMDYKLNANPDVLLIDASSSSSKDSWNLATDIIMESGGEYFEWNALKNAGEKVATRKRKTSEDATHDGPKGKQHSRGFKMNKDEMTFEEKMGGMKKNAQDDKCSARMPHWQVEDYVEIHQGIDSSLSLDQDLSPNQYPSDSMLTVNAMTVFKQEAPSPTMNEVAAQIQAARIIRQSPTSTQASVAAHPVNGGALEENSQTIFNNTINQLLSQSGLVNLPSIIDGNNLSASSPPSQHQQPHPQESYGTVSSTNYGLIEDCRFQYVLAAATSIATKQNEDTLTYLNQGQSYEIKLKKLGDLSMYRGKLLKSVIRICFHERRLQYIEKEQMEQWQKARPGDRILEVDVPLSYGAFDITQPSSTLNVVSFVWDPTKEVGIYIKVNCISTEFTPKKHGGEKGVPFRIQVETYQNGDSLVSSKRLHAAACQIKVFKLKGADRKHKQDREKIQKRTLAEQEKYQPSYECTVLSDIANDAVLQSPVPIVPYTVSESTADLQRATAQVQQLKSDAMPSAAVRQFRFSSGSPTLDKRDESSNDSSVTDSHIELTETSNPDDTARWLTANRFTKYLDMFANFSGSDMLRLSRDDLIQFCGNVDGIRLHNIVHMKPMVTLHVRLENESTFTPIFVYSGRYAELLQKLCAMTTTIVPDQVRAVTKEDSDAVQVLVTNDALRNMENETKLTMNVVRESSGCYVLLLKNAFKS